MKKTDFAITTWIAAILLCAGLSGLSSAAAQDAPPLSLSENKERLSSAEAKKLLAGRARLALRAIKDRDAATLATLVHPDKGVRFSSYGYIQIETDRVLTGKQVRRLFTDNQRYVWGDGDNSDEEIKLTGSEFFKQWVYDRDFLKAPQVFYNKVVFGGTTMSCNIDEVYPRTVFVTFHFPGSTPNELDWTSLCLGFEKKNGKWYLVGVVHNVWTI